MVPMAPSSTRMRWRASALRAIRCGEGVIGMGSGCFPRAVRPDAEQVADGEDEVGAVHGVEMEGVDAVLGELLHLAGDHGGGDQFPGLGVVIEALEFFRQP